MFKELTEFKIPVKMWIPDIEAGAMHQIRNLAEYPFAVGHIVVLPDCHEGFGMPIGSVMATKNVVVPNAVGVDIGCGMSAIRTNLTEIKTNELKRIITIIKNTIPLGHNHNKNPQDESLMPEDDLSKTRIVKQEFKSALKQLGSLGGGNHFIEFQIGSDGFVWIMIHSGSRNLGHKVATYYNKLANSMMQRFDIKIPKHVQLAYLPMDIQEGRDYLREMNYCVEFALANRKLMLAKIKQIVGENIKNVIFYDYINIAHNYARLEKHFGKHVMVHRKGATSAFKGEKGIIPGSQGSKSFIVEGLGNVESFKSCSHGAGRVMGRKEAVKKLNLNYELEIMNRQGIIHNIKTQKDLDEAVSAYKDINMVMSTQKDLVRIITELSPLAVIKA